jgi:predicted HD phosphohydrolase
MHIFTDVEELIGHLEELGRTTSAECRSFSELDHGLQCAALLERSDPDDVELQIAGLLHDLAHAWDGPGQPRHGSMGAEAVRPVLGDRVAALIEGHVPAKRYLVAVRPDYEAKLSPDSVMTLDAQGGPMTLTELDEFGSHEDWRAMVSLRVADDGPKVAGAVVSDLSRWVDSIRSLTRSEP